MIACLIKIIVLRKSLFVINSTTGPRDSGSQPDGRKKIRKWIRRKSTRFNFNFNSPPVVVAKRSKTLCKSSQILRRVLGTIFQSRSRHVYMAPRLYKWTHYSWIQPHIRAGLRTTQQGRAKGRRQLILHVSN